MKRIYYFICLIVVLILISGCKAKTSVDIKETLENNTEVSENNSEVSEDDTETSEDNTGTSDDNTEELSRTADTDISKGNEGNIDIIEETDPSELVEGLKVPEPASEASVNWECGTYYSDISTDNLKAYLRQLKDEGWIDMQGNAISTDITDGITEYMLTREDDLLQIMVFLKDREQSICNGLLVRKDKNVITDAIKARKDAVTKDEAVVKIQQYVDNVQDNEGFPYDKEAVIGVFEIFLKDAFEKLELQAYAAITDSGYYGCYLIRRGVVSYIEGNLTNTCIADIDLDDKFELLNIYSPWASGLKNIILTAYEYATPIYFSSLTEILQVKYSSCFVSKESLEELYLRKIDDTTVKLTNNYSDFGNIIIDGDRLLVEDMEALPYVFYSDLYKQEELAAIDKVIPTSPPDITILIDGLGVDYTVRKTDWAGVKKEYTISEAYSDIKEKDQFVPTFILGGMFDEDIIKSITVDFGESIPDSIRIYDDMLDTDGSVRYGGNMTQEQVFQILDDSHIQFNLVQHMTFYLSSNSEDYKRDWLRLFRVVCRWGEKECVYAFLLNTGINESLTEITDHQFLRCEDTFSLASSTWGMGINLDSSNLPDQYLIEWQISGGIIKTWDNKGLRAQEITQTHRGYPMTSSGDDNKGAVIWHPGDFNLTKDVIITAYIYKNNEDKCPIAYSRLTLQQNESGVYQKKD